MPQLVALHKRKGDKGLVVIGMHVQSATDEEIEATTKRLKMKFPVVKGGSVPGGGGGIPRVAVFDATGKMLFTGHPSEREFDKSVDAAMKTVAAGAAGGSGLDSKPGGGSGLTPSKTETKPAAPAVLFPEREWTNAEGKKMTAALLSVSGDTGTFKMKNGKTFTYAISKLSEEDQTAIKEAAEAKKE